MFDQFHDLDISIKETLTTRHCTIYGEVFPYFHLGRYLMKTTVVKKLMVVYKVYIIVSGKIPEKIKYFFLVSTAIVGWYVDFIKDILIAMDISFLYTSLFDFKSQVKMTNQTVLSDQSYSGCCYTVDHRLLESNIDWFESVSFIDQRPNKNIWKRSQVQNL